MQNRENFILLGVNTIIIILVLVMLFRMQDNKIKIYLKKSEKKLDEFIQNQQILHNKINQQISSQHHKIMNINPMPLQQQSLLNNNEDNNEDNNPVNNNPENNNPENQNRNDNNNLNNDIDSYIDPLNE